MLPDELKEYEGEMRGLIDLLKADHIYRRLGDLAPKSPSEDDPLVRELLTLRQGIVDAFYWIDSPVRMDGKSPDKCLWRPMESAHFLDG